MEGDGTRLFARTLTDALGADVVRGRGRCRSPEELTRLLGRYRLVLMSSVKWHEMERLSADAAWHVYVARRLGETSLVPTLHNTLDPDRFDRANATHAKEIIRLCRRVWTNDVTNLHGCSVVGEVIESRRLPYAIRSDLPRRRLPTARTLLSTCRVVSQKDLEAPLRGGWRGDYTLVGRSPFTTALSLYRKLLKRYHATPLIEANEQRWSGQWSVRLPEAGIVSYLGGFNGLPPLSSGDAHFMASPGRYLEYVTLEALDAGLPCVVPECTVTGLDHGNAALVTYRSDEEIPTAIERALGYEGNRSVDARALLAEHDPRFLVRRLLEDL